MMIQAVTNSYQSLTSKLQSNINYCKKHPIETAVSIIGVMSIIAYIGLKISDFYELYNKIPDSCDLSYNCSFAKADLHLDGTPTCSEINSAFRKLAKVYHPDKGGNDAAFRTINDARDILKEHYSCS